MDVQMHRIKCALVESRNKFKLLFFPILCQINVLFRQSWGWIAIILSTFKTEHFKLKQSIFSTWQHKVSDPFFCSHLLLATNWIAQASPTFFIWYIKSWSTKTWFAKKGPFFTYYPPTSKFLAQTFLGQFSAGWDIAHKEFDFGLATTK